MKYLALNIKRSIVLVLFIFHLVVSFAQEFQKEKLEALFSEIDFNTVYYPKVAKLQLDSLKSSFSVQQIEEYKGYIHFLNAQSFYNDLEVDSSLHHLDKALPYFTQQENNVWLAKIQFLLGAIAEATGLYEQAKINYYETIKLASNQQEEGGLSYLGIARCKKALDEVYSEELVNGLKLLEEDERLEVRLYSRFTNSLFHLTKKESMIELKQIADKYLELKMINRVINTYKVLASSFHAQNKYDSAHVYCDKAIDISERNDIGKLTLPALYQFKGMLFFKQERFNIADVYFSKSLSSIVR